MGLELSPQHPLPSLPSPHSRSAAPGWAPQTGHGRYLIGWLRRASSPASLAALFPAPKTLPLGRLRSPYRTLSNGNVRCVTAGRECCTLGWPQTSYVTSVWDRRRSVCPFLPALGLSCLGASAPALWLRGLGPPWGGSECALVYLPCWERAVLVEPQHRVFACPGGSSVSRAACPRPLHRPGLSPRPPFSPASLCPPGALPHTRGRYAQAPASWVRHDITAIRGVHSHDTLQFPFTEVLSDSCRRPVSSV